MTAPVMTSAANEQSPLDQYDIPGLLQDQQFVHALLADERIFRHLVRTNQIPILFPDWVKASLYSRMSGFSMNALAKKREHGVWIEEVHWTIAADGNVYYNWREIDNWVLDSEAPPPRRRT